MDNVILSKGKVYIVTDDPAAFPPLSAIVAALGPGLNTWQVISLEEGRDIIGSYGGMYVSFSFLTAQGLPHALTGVCAGYAVRRGCQLTLLLVRLPLPSWYLISTVRICNVDNSTLLALWRTYSSLSSSSPSPSPSNSTAPHTPHLTPLPPPYRLIFPHFPVFTDPNPHKHFHLLPRRRADAGFHPFTLKAAFPSLTVFYQDDWEDFHKIGAPFVLERVVVADREAAAAEAHRKARVGDVPWAGVFLEEQQGNQNRHAGGLGEEWMEPVRKSLVEYFGLAGKGKEKKKKVVTYVHRQNANAGGLRLSNADHEALMRELKKLELNQALRGCEVHVVSSSSRPDGVTGWTDRMRAIVQSSVSSFLELDWICVAWYPRFFHDVFVWLSVSRIFRVSFVEQVVLGVGNGDLLDAAFMKPSPQATLMEFFPDGRFFRDEEVVLRSRGVNYMAWWSDR